jgi:hypothetical protein
MMATHAEDVMTELHGWWDYTRLFTLAAILGAIGGLVFELLQAHRGQTGWVELPRSVQGRRYRDWGVFANMVIGAVAAVAALWIFPPEEKTVVDAMGKSITTTQYDVIKVVGLSLIIGSAGSSFLSAMQARALALVKDQQANQAVVVASKQLALVQSSVEADASKEQLAAQLASAKIAVKSIADSGAGNPEFE